MPTGPVLVVEDDYFTRMIQVVLDPRAPAERLAAFTDFFAHDLPDFDNWCVRLRARVGALHPAEVRMVRGQDELRRNLPDATAVVVERLRLDAADIGLAPHLVAVQKYGTVLRNIDEDACRKRNIPILLMRRRSNIACAEHTLLMMLMLARRANELDGIVSVNHAEAAGYPYRPFDRRHTANSNWSRIPGLRMLNESTVGIIGMGEIGREIALRTNAFGMKTLYCQRSQLPPAQEAERGIHYRQLDALLAESDFVVPTISDNDETRHLIDRRKIALMKRGAIVVNVSRPHVIERGALIDALESGHIGGFGLDPQYEEPGRDDDELLKFPNVILTPHTAAQPRFNALNDMTDLISGLAEAISSRR